MITMRAQHPSFRMDTWDDINSNISTNMVPYDTNGKNVNAVAVTIDSSNYQNDTWQSIIVIYNPSFYNYAFTLNSSTNPRNLEYYVFADISDVTSNALNNNDKSKIYSNSSNSVVNCGGPAVTVIFSPK
jgi:hypothetical protein